MQLSTIFNDILNENKYRHCTENYDFYNDERFHEFFYTDLRDNPKKVKEFQRWLVEYQNCYCYLYHGTDAAIPILTQGLKRTKATTKKSMQSTTGYVYLSVFPELALEFGKIAYPHAKEIAVYQVLCRIGSLLPDKDQIRNVNLYGGHAFKNSLAISLLIGHGARVNRDIEPNELNLFAKKDYRK